MNTTYRGRELVIGERIPRTDLVFVGTVNPRKGRFQCICGEIIVANMSAIECGGRKSCGCGKFKRRKGIRLDERI